jgi:hypothetical protein
LWLIRLFPLEPLGAIRPVIARGGIFGRCAAATGAVRSFKANSHPPRPRHSRRGCVLGGGGQGAVPIRCGTGQRARSRREADTSRPGLTRPQTGHACLPFVHSHTIFSLARRGSVWHGPPPWRRPRPQTWRFAAAATASGERWISLRELAEARGISQRSTTQLARRNGWRRQKWAWSGSARRSWRRRRPSLVGRVVPAAGWRRWRWPARGVGGASRPPQRPAGEGEGFASSQRPGGAFGDMSHGRQAGQFGQVVRRADRSLSSDRSEAVGAAAVSMAAADVVVDCIRRP